MGNLNYTKANYSVELGFLKPADAVFSRAIDLAGWWPEEFVGDGLAPGAEFVLKTGEGHYSKNKVIEFIKDRRLVWLATESLRKTDNFDWSGTRFIIDVIPDGDRTTLRLTYDGVVLEDEKEKLMEICELCVKEMFYKFVESFSATIEAAKPAGTVFQCITRDVAKWWGGEDLTGGSARLNDEFIIDHPGTHYSRQVVVEFVPDKRLVWLVAESSLPWLNDPAEWTGTKMVFDLTGSDGHSVLRFRHEGLTPEKQSYARCSEGWSMVIKDWLLDFISYGRPHFNV